MKTTLTALCILLLALSGCNASIGVGAGTGTSRVGVGFGGGRSAVGVGTYGGTAISLNAYKDFLNNGPTDIYKANKTGIAALTKGDYQTAYDVFRKNLELYPNHPDSTYYMGITLIYLDRRQEGFALLKQYRDPDNYRMTSEVQRTAAFLEPKTDVSAKDIHHTLNRNRSDGYDREMRERLEMLPSRW